MPIVLDGTAGITTPDLTDTSLTSGRVVYAGASGNLTTSAGLTFDGNNLGVGVTPSSWSLGKALEIGTAAGNAVWGVGSSNMNLTSNIYFNSGYKFAGTGFGGTLSMASGSVSIASTTASGTAGAAASFTDILAVSLGNSVALQGATTKAGTGITFPATQSASSDANTLDDYEEGTWTPTISGSSTAGTGTYTTQNGRYTKRGNQVTVSAYINWTAHTGTGNMLLSGLPFTVLNASNVFYSVSFGLFRNVTLTASNVATAYAVFNQTYCDVAQYPVGGGNATNVAIDTSAEIMYTLTYFSA